jgi:Cu/Ag efflux protein CusF
MINKFKLLTATAVLTLLSACGGGGGGVSGPVASTETFSLAKVWANMLTTPSSHKITISGTIDGVAVTGSGTTTFSNLSAGTFEGLPAQKQTQSGTASLVRNGQTTPVNFSTDTWVDSNYTPKGETDADNDYVVVTALGNLPTDARINATGTLYTANRFATSTKAVLNGTRTATYLIEADTASTALVTMTLEHKNTSNVTTSKSTQQFRITPTGTFTRIKETTVYDKTSLTITY